MAQRSLFFAIVFCILLDVVLCEVLHQYENSDCTGEVNYWFLNESYFCHTEDEYFVEVHYNETEKSALLKYCTFWTVGCCLPLEPEFYVPPNVCTPTETGGPYYFLIDNILPKDSSVSSIVVSVIFDVLFTLALIPLLLLAWKKKLKLNFLYYSLQIVALLLILISLVINIFRLSNTIYHAIIEFIFLVLLLLVNLFELKNIRVLLVKVIAKLVLYSLLYVNYVIFFVFIPEDYLFYNFIYLSKQIVFINVILEVMEENAEFKIKHKRAILILNKYAEISVFAANIFLLVYQLTNEVSNYVSLFANISEYQATVFYINYIMVCQEIKGLRGFVLLIMLANIGVLIYSVYGIFKYVITYVRWVVVAGMVSGTVWGYVYAGYTEFVYRDLVDD